MNTDFSTLLLANDLAIINEGFDLNNFQLTEREELMPKILWTHCLVKQITPNDSAKDVADKVMNLMISRPDLFIPTMPDNVTQMSVCVVNAYNDEQRVRYTINYLLDGDKRAVIVAKCTVVS